MAIDFYAQREKNTRKTILLIVIFIAVLGAIGYGVDRIYLGTPYPIITTLAVLIASIQSIVAYYAGDRLVLATVGAQQLDPSVPQEKQLYNVVSEMSIASGLPMPKIYIFHEDSPNAFATGRDEQHSSIAVTDGLLYTLNREELQGVIAHEMAHVRNRDILTMTIVSALLGAILLLSDWTRRILFYGGGSRGSRKRDSSGGGGIFLIVFIVLIILSPIIARLIAMAVSRSREYMADAGSVEFTRNPEALASALEKISHAADQVVDKATQGTAHLFIYDPMKRALNNKVGFFAELFSTHPPIEKRIQMIRGMEQK
jgi:heat shock protein HtpX